MPRYKLTVEYCGTGYYGWQTQEGLPTVQGVLEQALCQLNGGIPVATICAGRTDAGVHARGQVVHVDMAKPLAPHQLVMGSNFYMQNDRVVVVEAEAVPDDFNARFGALQREYEYHIINRTAWLALEETRAWHVPEALDTDAMHAAAQQLLGTHDFTSFRATECQAQSPIRTLDRLDVVRQGDRIVVSTASRSFLHHQVRNMVGSLRNVGNGRWNADDLMHALHAKKRAAAGETAPAHGLYFMRVHYPKA